MDILTPQERSDRMARIRGADTRPELVVRRLATSLGYHYRLHRRDLPGTPDLVFPTLKKVIFVHGCYWPRHSCRQGRSTPATRYDFWNAKFNANMARDRRVRLELKRAGWQVLV